MGGFAGGCATATGINPAVPPAEKLVQSPAQTASTPASAGATMPMNVKPEDKPTYVAQARDPVAYSVADNLFWNDIMMEHAMFMALLMPGRELDSLRAQAEDFQRQFAQHLQAASGIRPDNYVAFNRRSIDLARRISDYKKTTREQQLQAKVRTLVWPLFFEHTAREADPSPRVWSSITGGRSSSTARKSSTSGRNRWASIRGSSRIFSIRRSVC